MKSVLPEKKYQLNSRWVETIKPEIKTEQDYLMNGADWEVCKDPGSRHIKSEAGISNQYG